MFSDHTSLFCATAVPALTFWVDKLWYLYWINWGERGIHPFNTFISFQERKFLPPFAHYPEKHLHPIRRNRWPDIIPCEINLSCSFCIYIFSYISLPWTSTPVSWADLYCSDPRFASHFYDAEKAYQVANSFIQVHANTIKDICHIYIYIYEYDMCICNMIRLFIQLKYIEIGLT